MHSNRLNKELFYVNCGMIEFEEETPDPISMMSGCKFAEATDQDSEADHRL